MGRKCAHFFQRSHLTYNNIYDLMEERDDDGSWCVGRQSRWFYSSISTCCAMDLDLWERVFWLLIMCCYHSKISVSCGCICGHHQVAQYSSSSLFHQTNCLQGRSSLPQCWTQYKPTTKGTTQVSALLFSSHQTN